MLPIREWLARLNSHEAPATLWAAQRRQEAERLLGNAEESGNWIELTVHHNGFVREVAVRALRDQPSPEALVALIDRLNDWVPQIRDLAGECLKHYLSPCHVQALLFALKPLIALASRHRADHASTLKAVRSVLQMAEAQDQVYAGFLKQQGNDARYLFTLLLESTFNTQKLLQDALAHRELTVRLMAVAATQALPDAQALPLLREAVAHPGAGVRVCILRALLPLLEDPRSVLQAALFDSSPSIRNLARWAAPNHDVDARVLLVERLTGILPTAKRDWLGILGLAAEIDIELEERWLLAAARSSYPAVRRAAMSHLGTGHLSELLAALDDPSDKVFFAAIAQLREQSWASLQARLNAKLDKDWHDLSAKRLQMLIRLRPQWQQVDYLLGRLAREPAAQVFWAKQINKWCDDQYQIVDPITSKAERKELMEKLQELSSDGFISSVCVARVC